MFDVLEMNPELMLQAPVTVYVSGPAPHDLVKFTVTSCEPVHTVPIL